MLGVIYDIYRVCIKPEGNVWGPGGQPDPKGAAKRLTFVLTHQIEIALAAPYKSPLKLGIKRSQIMLS